MQRIGNQWTVHREILNARAGFPVAGSSGGLVKAGNSPKLQDADKQCAFREYKVGRNTGVYHPEVET